MLLVNREVLNSAFKNFSESKLLVVGDIMIDSYLWGNVNRISPEAPVPVVSCYKRESRLGGAANVALNIASLGAKPILLSVVGDDTYGRVFCDLAEESGINCEGVVVDHSRPSTVKTRIISGGQQLLRVDDEIDTYVSDDIHMKMVERAKSILSTQDIDAVILEDYDKGVLSSSFIESIVKLCEEKQIPVLVDPKSRNYQHFKSVTVFKPNFKEFCDGLGVVVAKDDFEKLIELGNHYRNLQDIDYLFLTLSENGVLLIGEESHHFTAYKRDVADVSGAGDTVISVMAVAMAAGLSIDSCAHLANIAGGMVCEKVGVVPIDKNDLFHEACSIFGI